MRGAAAAYQPAHNRIIRFVFPDPDEPTTHLMPGERPVRDGQDRAPAVADGADGRAHHDRPAPVGEGTLPGAVTRPRAVRACPAPLPGVEDDGAVAVCPERPVSMA